MYNQLLATRQSPDLALAHDSGDAATAPAVLEAEMPRLLALAYSVLRDRDRAADAVQDTMEIALRSWLSLREVDRRAAWLSTICVRRALRLARADRRSQLLPWAYRPPPVAVASALDIDLERALLELTAKQRAVVGLHYVYGYTLDETAAAIGCRPGTARSHLNRALTTLRHILGDDRDDYGH